MVAGLGILAHWTRRRGAAGGARAACPDARPRAGAATGRRCSPRSRAREFALRARPRPGARHRREAALKFKETCGIHAEAYSAAEVLHGPARIVEAGFPVLALRRAMPPRPASPRSPTGWRGRAAASSPPRRASASATRLPFAATGHPITDALALIVSFYGFVEALSRHRGFDPDHPPHLKKVTETL